MYISIIIVFILALYYRTFNFSIIVDDIRRYKEMEKGFGTFKWWDLKSAVTHIYNRFYGGCTFGRNTITDHMVTTAMHIIICLLIYTLFGMNWVSFVTAMLYACNPINNQTSIWINGRRYAMCILLMLLMMLLKPWAIVLYPFMMVFQVTGLFVPVMYMDVSWLFILLIPLLMFLGRKRFTSAITERYKDIKDKDHRIITWKRMFIIVKCYGFYFFKMIIPYRVLMNYMTLYKWGLTEEGNKDAYSFNLEFWKGMLALGITGWGLFYFKGNLFYMWLFMFLSIFQWSGFIGAFQLLADRYISLANVFLMYFIVYLADHFLGIYSIALFTLMAGYYIAELDVVMRMYQSIDDFFNHQIYYAPRMSRNRSFRANYFMKVNNLSKAWSLIEDGLAKDPSDFALLFDAANCSRMVGNYPKAEAFLQEAEKHYYIDQEETMSQQVKKLRNKIEEEKAKTIKMQKEYLEKMKKGK